MNTEQRLSAMTKRTMTIASNLEFWEKLKTLSQLHSQWGCSKDEVYCPVFHEVALQPYDAIHPTIFFHLDCLTFLDNFQKLKIVTDKYIDPALFGDQKKWVLTFFLLGGHDIVCYPTAYIVKNECNVAEGKRTNLIVEVKHE